jgi:SSS family solute:Na+ symporter
LAAMILGGTTTVLLTSTGISLPWGLDANIFGISASAITYILLYQLNNIGINVPALISIFVNQKGKKNKNG